MEPFNTPGAESLFQVTNVVVNFVGVAGVVGLLIKMIQLSRWVGGMETIVKEGFVASEKKHIEVAVRISGHSSAIGELTRAVGRLEGKIDANGKSR